MADSLERFAAARERETAARAAFVACPRHRPLRRGRLLLRCGGAQLALTLARAVALAETRRYMD